MTATDARRSAPHVARNTGPIIDVLRGILPDEGLVLEIASGSGEHILAFAQAFPRLLWQPTDADPVSLRSADAWRMAQGAPNLLAPVPLDAARANWPIEEADAILCINMVHISPWAATEGLMRGAGKELPSGAPLYLYGAYFQDGVEPAPSNVAFNASLMERNPQWGVRRLEEVVEEAGKNGLTLDAAVSMPANNLSLVFRKR